MSKPVVYEHFGGKEGLYAVVVDREVRALLDRITTALTAGHPRELLEQAALALLDYIEEETDGFRVLVRESPVMSPTGNFSSRAQRRGPPGRAHPRRASSSAAGYDPKLAELYSQALVGMVALTGRWWLEVRKPRKEMVAAHLVNLAWNGLSHLEAKPTLLTRKALSAARSSEPSPGVTVRRQAVGSRRAALAVPASGPTVGVTGPPSDQHRGPMQDRRRSPWPIEKPRKFGVGAAARPASPAPTTSRTMPTPDG